MAQGKPAHERILSVDVGSTMVKALILNKAGVIMGQHKVAVQELKPSPGRIEYDPEQLWSAFLEVCFGAAKDAKVPMSEIGCIGLSTQRSSFLTWSRSTGRPFHPVISWKDKRAEKIAREKNNNALIKILHFIGWIGFLVSGNQTAELLKSLCFPNAVVAHRLCWMLKDNLSLKGAILKKDAMYGTLDTWFLYKLTEGLLHVTVPDQAITTGIWSMLDREYHPLLLRYFGIPNCSKFLPTVVENSHTFGVTSSSSFFGVEIPISAVMSDSMSSCYAHNLQSPGSAKVSLGTGTFLTCNTGKEPLLKFDGLYPIVGWTTAENEFNRHYFVERSVSNTSRNLQWLESSGLCASLEETSDIAFSKKINQSSPVFVSSFGSSDDEESSALLGIQRHHDRSDLIKAVLESTAFEVKHMMNIAERQLPDLKQTAVIRVDGGGAKNDFLLQSIANLTEKTVQRTATVEMASIGVALMAGLQGGVWPSEKEMRSINWAKEEFHPKSTLNSTEADDQGPFPDTFERFNAWKRAIKSTEE